MRKAITPIQLAELIKFFTFFFPVFDFQILALVEINMINLHLAWRNLYHKQDLICLSEKLTDDLARNSPLVPRAYLQKF